MLNGHNSRATQIIVLAVAINALVVMFWLALTSIIPVGILPGFGLSHEITMGANWVETLGPSILWFGLFAIAGVLVAARIRFMQWVLRVPAPVDPPEVERRSTSRPQWCMSYATVESASRRPRRSLKS